MCLLMLDFCHDSVLAHTGYLGHEVSGLSLPLGHHVALVGFMLCAVVFGPPVPDSICRKPR